MKTIIKKTGNLRNKSRNTEPEQTEISQGTPDTISTALVDFSPLNYRKHFRKNDLESFAQELKLHGIISPLTVRKKANGRFELVVGERRLRAAHIAGLATVPVIIKDLTDEEVTEMQLAENLQRENPHPLDDAGAVKLMQDTGKSIDEIAVRLGKSKQFVYLRLKLLNLIEAVYEMFYEDVITLQQALEIAAISQDAQTAFFNDHCKKWKQKNFVLDDLAWRLRKYKYDLARAPFNIKDKTLLPEVGACTGCRFNSATMKSLFPDDTKESICSNPSCYGAKCEVNSRIAFIDALLAHNPVAFLCNGEQQLQMKELLSTIPQSANLLLFDRHAVTIIEPPEEPMREDYIDDYSDEEPVFDEEGYVNAVNEYEFDMAEYEERVREGKYQTALVAQHGRFHPVLFSTEPPTNMGNNSDRGVTMKAVQEALKNGTATVSMLDEAIAATLKREERAKEIDRDKVQAAVHKAFEEGIADLANITALTEADLVAARLLVYQSLDYGSRHKVDTALFGGEEHGDNAACSFCRRLAELTDAEYSYLIRLAIAGKQESKQPYTVTGIALYNAAASAGVTVTRIEQEQELKARNREDRMKKRMHELENKKEKLAKHT